MQALLSDAGSELNSGRAVDITSTFGVQARLYCDIFRYELQANLLIEFSASTS